MPECYNCGTEVGITIANSACSASDCRNIVKTGEGGSNNYYCPHHQQEFPRKIRELKKHLADLQADATGLHNPNQENLRLRAENQALTTTLGLKDRELNDLQAEIRAVHSQLTEQENNQPLQLKINELARRLELVKQKLAEWSNLLSQ